MVSLRSFDVELVTKFNSLHNNVHGEPFNSQVPPNAPSNEVVGLEYLFRQINMSFTDNYVDSGIEDGCNLDDEGIQEDLLSEEDFSINHPTEPNPVEDEEDEEDVVEVDGTATDSKGIPGWEKVDALAQALISLTGISLTNNDAKRIEKLFRCLNDYDKQPLVYKVVLHKPAKGRFCARKRGGYDGLVKMKRCFISGTSPALSPSKSRLVEAICIHLCQRITTPSSSILSDGTKQYNSRWKQILREYDAVRARLMNSQHVLDNIDITLYNINETTLRSWFKDKTRTNEIMTLMQGRHVPPQRNIAKEPLLNVREKPCNMQGTTTVMSFPEAEDRSGQAVKKYRRKKRSLELQQPTYIAPKPVPSLTSPTTLINIPPLSSPSLTSSTNFRFTPPFPPVIIPPASSPFTMFHPPCQQPILPENTCQIPSSKSSMSRSTYYRHLKKAATDIGPTRKTYSCRKCGRAMSDGLHRQFRGERYCPYEPGALPHHIWLLLKRKEMDNKRKKKE